MSRQRQENKTIVWKLTRQFDKTGWPPEYPWLMDFLAKIDLDGGRVNTENQQDTLNKMWGMFNKPQPQRSNTMDILFPAGRMIGGNLDKTFPRTEADGKTPKIGRDGNPEMQCSFGFAIPKGAETHWNQAPWGAEIYKVGAAAHPTLVASPAFSWKITDGDSQLPNKRGKRPCDQTGYPGHWVIWFSQGWLPKRVNANGTVELPEGSIVPGYFIQVFGSVTGNKLVPNGTPGVYLNPIAVALVGEGDKIVSNDVDTTAVGFGGSPLPAGARPVQAAAPAFAGQVAPPVLPAAMGGIPMHVTPPMPPGVQPAPDFLNPPPPAGPRMTPAATATREQYHAAGWTDAQLIQNGLMVA